MSKISQIEVIATDGKKQMRLIWLVVKSSGVYLDFCQEGRNSHITYHSDGHTFHTVDDRTMKGGKFQPLQGFRNIEQIAAFGFDPLLVMGKMAPYKMGRVRAAVFVDLRSYVDCQVVNCLVSLLEPNRFDLLKTWSSLKPEQIHVFTFCEPWIVIEMKGVPRNTAKKASEK